MSSDMIESGGSWAQKVVYLYEEGRSDAEVAAALRIPIKDYYKHINDNPTFAKLVDFGRTLAQAFWEGKARENISNKSFNSSLYAFYMKNKFGWADKVETTNSSENYNIDIDALRADVYAKVQKLLKKNQPELTDAAIMSSLPIESDDE